MSDGFMPNSPDVACFLANLPTATTGTAGFVPIMYINNDRVITTGFFYGKTR